MIAALIFDRLGAETAGIGAGSAGIKQAIEGGAADAEHLCGAQLIAFYACQHHVNVAKDCTIEVRVILGGDGLGSLRERHGG